MNQDNFNQTELAMICNRVLLGTASFERFLAAQQGRVEQWLQSDQFNAVADLANIATAYLTNKDALQLSAEFLESLELAILKRVTQMTPTLVLPLLDLFSDTGSTELYECLDRIIGRGIDELTASDILEAFVSFRSVQKAQIRPKIFTLLLKRISQHMDAYTIRELTALAAVLQHEWAVADSLGLSDTLIERCNALTGEDLANLLCSLKQEQDPRLFEVLEQRLISELAQKRVSLGTVSAILYDYSKHRRGSANMI